MPREGIPLYFYPELFSVMKGLSSDARLVWTWVVNLGYQFAQCLASCVFVHRCYKYAIVLLSVLSS